MNEPLKRIIVPRNKGHGLQRYNIRNFVERAKTLQGDPHYIAMGMAIGVFVSITPTVPFHTIIAIALAFILKGGLILGIIPGIAAYFITRKIFTKIRMRKKLEA